MIQGVNKWNLLEQSKYIEHKDLKQVKDVIPQCAERQIKVDTVELSREGMEALRERVQSMPGHIDVEEIMRMREILPKLSMNPSDDFLWAMRDDMQNSLNHIKQSKGSYTFDDLVSIRMDAYEKQYDALRKSYDEGTRDIYVSDGIDENGKLKYHKVAWEEDEAYLNEAFGRIAEELAFSARSQQISWQIKEKFGGGKAPQITLPEGYTEKLSDILTRAAFTYADQKEKGNPVDAAGLALKYLNEDKGFADAMRRLYSNIKPLP